MDFLPLFFFSLFFPLCGQGADRDQLSPPRLARMKFTSHHPFSPPRSLFVPSLLSVIRRSSSMSRSLSLSPFERLAFSSFLSRRVRPYRGGETEHEKERTGTRLSGREERIRQVASAGSFTKKELFKDAGKINLFERFPCRGKRGNLHGNGS